MASLTQTAIIARKIIRYSIYLVILLIIARFAFRGGVFIYRTLNPEPPPEPEVAFDKLPELPFPEKEIPQDIAYTLETPEGNLPQLPILAEVYFMPRAESTLRTLESARNKARAMGFDPNGRPIVENVPSVYVFEKQEDPSLLTMNIVTNIFSISYDLSANPAVLDGIPPDEEAAKERARELLASAGLLTEDLNGPVTHQFFRLESGRFTSALSLSDAQATKVNFFRGTYGGVTLSPTVTPEDGEPDQRGFPSVTQDMPEANVWFILGPDGKIIAGEYHYYPIDREQFSTYPLKTAEQAWEELQQGGGYIANLGDNPNGQIVIRRVYLAFYDAGQYAEFYQPVVVFEGDNDFYAFVPAVTDEYYGD